MLSLEYFFVMEFVWGICSFGLIVVDYFVCGEFEVCEVVVSLDSFVVGMMVSEFVFFFNVCIGLIFCVGVMWIVIVYDKIELGDWLSLIGMLDDLE